MNRVLWLDLENMLEHQNLDYITIYLFLLKCVKKPKVTKVNRIEVGFRNSQSQFSQNSQTRQVPEEALMLTGDENIVDLNFTIFGS